MKELAHTYFDYWNARDLDGLKRIFTPNVTLKDWEIEVSGADAVVAANQNIFDAVPNVKIAVVDLGVSDNKVMAEIIVDLGNGESIDVVDVLTVEGGKIAAVKAFKV